MTEWVLRRGFTPDADDLQRTVAHHETLAASLDRLRGVVYPVAGAVGAPATVRRWIETNR